jgi:hypothetical protein
MKIFQEEEINIFCRTSNKVYLDIRVPEDITRTTL